MKENEGIAGLVSVIVPIFNVEKYLVRCLDSICMQSYKNIEIILVDDGSTDNSPRICDQYGETDSRIQVIHKSNGGLSHARNVGIDNARGQYICFVDSDDWVERDYVRYLYNLIEKYHSDISICKVQSVYEDKHSDRKKNPQQKLLEKKMSRVEAYKLVFMKSDVYGVFAWNKLFKKELFANIRFPVNRYYEDGITIYKLISEANTIACGNCEQYNYYKGRTGAITSGGFSNKLFDKMMFLEEIKISLLQNYPEAFSAYINYYIRSLLFIYRKAIQDNENRPVAKKIRKLINPYWKRYLLMRGVKTKDKMKVLLFELGPGIYKLTSAKLGDKT